MTDPGYVTFEDPYTVAEQKIQGLRDQGVDVVVGLTHLRRAQDEELLVKLGDKAADLYVGGHEHSKVDAEVERPPRPQGGSRCGLNDGDQGQAAAESPATR